MKHTSEEGMAPDYFEQENTMRRLQERDPIRAKEEMIEKFKHYVATYEPRMTLSPETFINDMLFGIGRSMSDEYNWAAGYRKFKGRIKEMIEEEEQK